MRCVLLVVVLACGGNKEPAPAPISNVSTTPTEPTAPPKTEQERILDKMGEFRDHMCKCAAGDADCAKAVADEMTKWSEAQPPPKEGEKMPAPDARAENLGRELGECMQRAMMPPQPPGDAGP